MKIKQEIHPTISRRVDAYSENESLDLAQLTNKPSISKKTEEQKNTEKGNELFQQNSAEHVKEKYGFEGEKLLLKPPPIITVFPLYPESPTTEDEQKAFDVGKAIEKDLTKYFNELILNTGNQNLQGTEGGFQQITNIIRSSGYQAFSGTDTKSQVRHARMSKFKSSLTEGGAMTVFKKNKGKIETNLLDSNLPPVEQDIGFGQTVITVPYEPVLPEAKPEYVTHLPDLKFRIEIEFPEQNKSVKINLQLDEVFLQ